MGRARGHTVCACVCTYTLYTLYYIMYVYVYIALYRVCVRIHCTISCTPAANTVFLKSKTEEAHRRGTQVRHLLEVVHRGLALERMRDVRQASVPQGVGFRV